MTQDPSNPLHYLEIPSDGQEPVFLAPWEAKAFAIVNQLASKDYCSWAEWTQYLVAEVTADELGSIERKSYYEQWVRACENLLIEKGIVNVDSIELRIIELTTQHELEHQH